jgi:hypothetical protein
MPLQDEGGNKKGRGVSPLHPEGGNKKRFSPLHPEGGEGDVSNTFKRGMRITGNDRSPRQADHQELIRERIADITVNEPELGGLYQVGTIKNELEVVSIQSIVDYPTWAFHVFKLHG